MRSGSGFKSGLVLSGPISLQACKLGFFQGLGQVTLFQASFSLSWRQVHRHSFGSWDTGVVLPSYISKTGVTPVEARIYFLTKFEAAGCTGQVGSRGVSLLCFLNLEHEC